MKIQKAKKIKIFFTYWKKYTEKKKLLRQAYTLKENDITLPSKREKEHVYQILKKGKNRL